MAEICKFVNDTDEVDLLDGTTFRLVSFESALPAPRATKRTPVYSDGSDLISRQFENVVETLVFTVLGASQDDALINLRNLTSILETGVNYYIGLATTQTYLQVKFENETNSRYGILKDWRIDKLPHMFDDSPFAVGGTAKRGTTGLHSASSMIYTVTLVVELEMYRSDPPGTYNTVLATAYKTFNSVNYGASTEASEVFVTNKYTVANISHVYRYDGASFSANIAGSTPPYNLFPSGMGSGDILYIGSQTSLANSGPFGSVVFDLDNSGEDTAMDIEWETWDGAAWVSLDIVTDLTNGFSIDGVNVVSWTQNSNGTAVSVNGVTAFWVRARIINTNSRLIIPQQQNSRLYSVTWPYLTIASDQIIGDEPALIKYTITQESWPGITGDAILQHVMMGVRSTSRGSNFSAYLNTGDEQQPAGVTYESPPTSPGTVTNDSLWPTGRRYPFVTVTDTATPIGRFTIAFPYSGEYKGKFRALLTVYFDATGLTGNVDNFSFYLRVTQSVATASYYQTEYRSPTMDEVGQAICIDMGEISILDKVRINENLAKDITIDVYGIGVTGESANIQVVQLVLLPVDEWSCEVAGDYIYGFINMNTVETDPIVGDILYLDGTMGTFDFIGIVADYSGFTITYPIYNSSTFPILQHHIEQRLWFAFVGATPVTGDYMEINNNFVAKVQLQAVYRYLTPRGSQ